MSAWYLRYPEECLLYTLNDQKGKNIITIIRLQLLCNKDQGR